MSEFELDPRLHGACHHLGQLNACHLLLMDNASLPWFILVPEVSATELCDLDADSHSRLFDAAGQVSRMVRANFAIDKLNVASLGNIVAQLHLHVIGRRQGDYCWPGGVWGPSHEAPYEQAALSQLRELVASALGAQFRPGDYG